MNIMSLLALACLAACGPSLRSLVDDHHDREAICGAADGGASDRAHVGAALDRDAGTLVHVSVIEPPAIAHLLGETTPEMRFARVELQTNILPVDDMSAQLALVAGPRALATPVDWDALARLTRETLPAKHVSSTYLTGGNFLRGAAAFLTMGASLMFTEFQQQSIEVDASDSEYAASAPRAHTLFHALASPGCSDRVADGGTGIRCTWFVLLSVEPSTADARLEIRMRYRAHRVDHRGQPSGDRCTVERTSTIPLGPASSLDATLARTFGPEMRRVGELATGK